MYNVCGSSCLPSSKLPSSEIPYAVYLCIQCKYMSLYTFNIFVESAWALAGWTYRKGVYHLRKRSVGVVTLAAVIILLHYRAVLLPGTEEKKIHLCCNSPVLPLGGVTQYIAMLVLTSTERCPPGVFLPLCGDLSGTLPGTRRERWSTRCYLSTSPGDGRWWQAEGELWKRLALLVLQISCVLLHSLWYCIPVGNHLFSPSVRLPVPLYCSCCNSEITCLCFLIFSCLIPWYVVALMISLCWLLQYLRICTMWCWYMLLRYFLVAHSLHVVRRLSWWHALTYRAGEPESNAGTLQSNFVGVSYTSIFASGMTTSWRRQSKGISRAWLRNGSGSGAWYDRRTKSVASTMAMGALYLLSHCWHSTVPDARALTHSSDLPCNCLVVTSPYCHLWPSAFDKTLVACDAAACYLCLLSVPWSELMLWNIVWRLEKRAWWWLTSAGRVMVTLLKWRFRRGVGDVVMLRGLHSLLCEKWSAKYHAAARRQRINAAHLASSVRAENGVSVSIEIMKAKRNGGGGEIMKISNLAAYHCMAAARVSASLRRRRRRESETKRRKHGSLRESGMAHIKWHGGGNGIAWQNSAASERKLQQLKRHASLAHAIWPSVSLSQPVAGSSA